jgi:DNA replication and repair protein RecF
MPIDSLSINRFRNLQPAELQLSPRLNLFVGDNAAGKTSLLEALFVLARGRSFRTPNLDKLIQHGEADFQLVARLCLSEGRSIPVGMCRSRGRLECRIDGRPIKRLSELATLFPVQWLGGDLHTLIEDGPAQRRQFVDWGLFHVKPDYMVLWKRFHKILKQRNAALRSSGSIREIKAWNPELAEAGEELHRYRNKYLDGLSAAFASVNHQFPITSEEVTVSYQKGWRNEASYLESLDAALAKDRESGFTRAGPQRAELDFRIDGKALSEQLSRGQQKIFITALQMTQAVYLYQETGKTSLFLLDDLGSELDSTNQRRALQLLSTIGAQVFATAIVEPALPDWASDQIKWFHVKHGVLSEVV